MPVGFPLQWPQGYRRTPQGQRRYLNGKVSLADARDRLFYELRLLGVDSTVVISSNMPLRMDGLPRADSAEPEDPGVAVYFTLDDRPLSFANDSYEYVRDNLRAIALTIEALRGLKRWGSSDAMDRAFRGFLALPQTASRPWREVFGFKPTKIVTRDDVEKVFRELSLKHHPDRGGDPELFRQLTEARATARQELSS